MRCLGWDKTFSLNHIQDEGFTEIHFFGDKVGHHSHVQSRLDFLYAYAYYKFPGLT